jgi:hypothetical protein
MSQRADSRFLDEFFKITSIPNFMKICQKIQLLIPDHKQADGQMDMVTALCKQPIKVRVLIFDQDNSDVNKGDTSAPSS